MSAEAAMDDQQYSFPVAKNRALQEQEGKAALGRLLHIALGSSDYARKVAAFLLALYNYHRFKFNLAEFCCLDHDIFDDCITVLKLERLLIREVHLYFENGGLIFEQMAKDWNLS